MIPRYSLYFLVFLLLAATNINSQSSDNDVHISLSIITDINKNEFHNYWESSPGGEFEFKFEHPIGLLGAGFNIMRFDKIVSSSKGFYGLNYYLLYAHQIELKKNISIYGGIRFGIFEYRFDSENIITDKAELNEREFFAALTGEISYEFINSWSLESSIVYSKTFTKKQIDLLYLNFGLKKSFTSPEWLKDILR